ncbi:MAG: hypothetical protein JW762_06480 [Dehalococcoidales bacterium]|nr:hypothetical protein [Dehalococcoidales bacterium]
MRTKKQFKGDAGEAFTRLSFILQNYNCTLEKQNNKGFDFIAKKKYLDGHKERIFVEVKAGFHDISPAQRKKKKEVEKNGEKYQVVRIYVPPIYYSEVMRMLWPKGFRKLYFGK